jgi:hypothetical protein
MTWPTGPDGWATPPASPRSAAVPGQPDGPAGGAPAGPAGEAATGPAGGAPTGPAWAPANPTEQALAEALASGDQANYFRILSNAELYLPQFLTAPPEGQQFVTVNMFGQTFLPVFTSIEAMVVAQVSAVAGGYVLTTHPELRRKWPMPQWRLAVNPGTPIDAYVEIGAVERAALGELALPTAGELILDAAAEEAATGALPAVEVDADEALADAASQGDIDGYVRILLDSVVVLPTARPVPDASALFEPDFPWRVTGSSIEVFTSTAALQRAHPVPPPSIRVSFPILLVRWPEGRGMSVNPGSATGVEISADQVRMLLLWADEDL